MMSIELVERVVRALDHVGIPYMVVGSFSSNVYGIPRSTKDADLVVQLRGDQVTGLGTQLTAEFEFDPQMTFETVTSTMKYLLRHRASPFTVELFELSGDPHDQARFARRSKVPFGSGQAFLPRPEDVVITKLRWSKQGQRSKDVDDVRDVLSVQHSKIDLEYVRSWCDQHGTRELFDRLFAEESADPVP
jgi:hypothetical protein